MVRLRSVTRVLPVLALLAGHRRLGDFLDSQGDAALVAQTRGSEGVPRSTRRPGRR